MNNINSENDQSIAQAIINRSIYQSIGDDFEIDIPMIQDAYDQLDDCLFYSLRYLPDKNKKLRKYF